MPVITYRDALNQALREEMARDKDVFLMGEEVGMVTIKRRNGAVTIQAIG